MVRVRDSRAVFASKHRPERYSCRATETAAISGFLSYPVFQQHATRSFLSVSRNRRRLHVSFSFRKRPRFRPMPAPASHLVTPSIFFPPSLLTPRQTPTDRQTDRPPLASPTRTPGMLFTVYVREISALEPERREKE